MIKTTTLKRINEKVKNGVKLSPYEINKIKKNIPPVNKEKLNEDGIIFKDKQLVKPVSISDYSFSTPTKPVLATNGLSACTAILAVDKEQKFAFLAHSDPIFSFKYPIGHLFSKHKKSKHIKVLEKYANLNKEYYNLDFIILTGEITDYKSVNIIVNNINNIKSKYITVDSIIIDKAFKSNNAGSVAIDSRNGFLYNYN